MYLKQVCLKELNRPISPNSECWVFSLVRQEVA